MAIHELGHVLGLGHPDQAKQSVTAIMNSTVSNIDTMQADDIGGVQLLYAAPGTIPDNNDFGGATTIILNSATEQFAGTNVAASRESGEPVHAGANAINGHSVWWKWTAPNSGSVTLTTLGSNYDSVLAVYTGASVSALSVVAANDDVQNGVIRTSTVTFNVTGGTTYSIAVDGWGSTAQSDQSTYTGAITLNLTFSGTLATAAPVINAQPKNQIVGSGSSAIFRATAAGNPLPTFQWQKNGVNLLGATNTVITIASVGAGDVGNYSVVATNVVGSATSNGAALTIGTAPVIIAQPMARAVATGASVSFSGAASGNPVPAFQWQKNGMDIFGATNATYAINAVGIGDVGNYSVVATNGVGSATSNSATLAIGTAPVITAQPTSRVVASGLAVSFAVSASGNPAPTFQWQKNGADILGATNATCTINSVSVGDAGSYAVGASNSVGSATSNVALLTVIVGPSSATILITVQ